MGKHVVLGAGQIGTMVARTLRARGEEVVFVRRSAAPSPVSGVAVVRGDLSDANFARSVGRGADVVYQCTNPLYHRWATELLPNIDGAIAAAKENSARLVVLDNVYAYGDTGTSPRHESTPMNPCSKKGGLRRLYAERAMAARAEGLRVTLVRASDFFGPGIEQAALGDRGLSRMLASKSVEVLGDIRLAHAYSYGPDVAEALVRTAALEEMPEVVHVPTLPARSTLAYVEAMAAALGVKPKTMRAPGWLLSAMGLFDPPMGELVEMLYQFEAPFFLEDARSRAVLGMEPTPFELQIAATADWARARFSTSASTAA